MFNQTIAQRGQRDWLNPAAALWFLVLLFGQWGFFYYIAGFYGVSTVSGDFEIWNRLEAFGGRAPYVAGDLVGNSTYLSHSLAAGIIALSGALQLVPWIRTRAPRFHRWNGRVFLFTVVALSLSGLALVWLLGRSPGATNGISTTVNGVLILSFAWFTYTRARAGEFEQHRRWALRLLLVSNAQWFLRIGQFGYFFGALAAGGEPSQAVMTFWHFGCFVVPLVVLEIYLWVEDHGRQKARRLMAVGLVAVSLVTAASIVPFSMFTHGLITGATMSLSE